MAAGSWGGIHGKDRQRPAGRTKGPALRTLVILGIAVVAVAGASVSTFKRQQFFHIEPAIRPEVVRGLRV
jgi:hypothetical protein